MNQSYKMNFSEVDLFQSFSNIGPETISVITKAKSFSKDKKFKKLCKTYFKTKDGISKFYQDLRMLNKFENGLPTFSQI